MILALLNAGGALLVILQVEMTNYFRGMRVRYTGTDPFFMGRNGTIIFYDNAFFIQWDNPSKMPFQMITQRLDPILHLIKPLSKEDTNPCKELPCKVCSKMNDLGINKCWWCSCDNPTG